MDTVYAIKSIGAIYTRIACSFLSSDCAILLNMRRFACLFAACVMPALALFAQEGWIGTWNGALVLSEGTMEFSLTVGSSGALLDLPSQNLYGYPSAVLNLSSDTLQAAWLFGGGQFLLTASKDSGGASGRYGQGGASGTFTMSRLGTSRRAGSDLSFTAADGAILPGTLLVPPLASGGTKPPLLILHAALGYADRDGNSYSIAGRNDALSQLASALASLGVASYRYDKRGSGMASWLVAKESDSRFTPWVEDLSACIDFFARDGRFSSVWVLGMNDGALVAAQAALASRLESGLIIACASADSPRDAYEEAVASAPAEQQAEGQAILAALNSGRIVSSPSAFYAVAFRESLQPYLADAFKYDLETQLRAYTGSVLIIQGDRDMQATFSDFTALGNAKPDAIGAVVPLMNHVLKTVPPNVDLNNLAFSDPSFPLADGLAQLIAHTLGLDVAVPF